MISLSVAQKLKEAGLDWTPTVYDFFMVPTPGLDDAIYVISDMAVIVEKLHGHLAVTFHGTPEWALDYILVSELVWLPTEAQLRALLERELVTEAQPALKLMSSPDGYVCEIQFQGQTQEFEAFGASDAYGLALLQVMTS